MPSKTLNIDYFNHLSKDHFPEFMGIKITHLETGKMLGEMSVQKQFFAPNGFLHAGSLVTFADTIAGYSCLAHLPDQAKSFTTIELKSNFTGAIKQGKIEGESVAEHLGRTTQVWRVLVNDSSTKKRLAVFSCTQLILY